MVIEIIANNIHVCRVIGIIQEVLIDTGKYRPFLPRHTEICNKLEFKKGPKYNYRKNRCRIVTKELTNPDDISIVKTLINNLVLNHAEIKEVNYI